MALFAFELGRVKELCLAELSSVLGNKNLTEVIGNFAIFNTDLPLQTDPQKLQNRLGGTIKITQIIKTIKIAKSTSLKKEIQECIKTILIDHTNKFSGKIPFAISAINIQDNTENFLKFFLNFSKRIIKSIGKNSRFVNKPWINPTSAQIYKSRAVEKGIDITIIEDEKTETIYIAKTISIQDIDLYSIRDFEKPFRDAHMGMLPPKLAQIMINLADPENTAKTIYDPFCGSGTILIEAMIMGKNAIGSDIDEKAVNGTSKNLEWTMGKLKNKSVKFKIFKKNAVEITKKDILPESVDAIVSETYLGEPVSRLPSEKIVEKVLSDISNLHELWLKKATQLLSKNARIAICLPAYRKGFNKYIRIKDFSKKVEKYGLKQIKFGNASSLIYDREDQVVAREIVILQNSIENE